MFRSIVVALALLGSAAACNFISAGVQGSGVQAREERQVPAFEQVELDGSAAVEIEVGRARSVRIEADDNIIPLITTEVAGKTLKISSHGSYSTSNPVKVWISLPRLVGVAADGSGSIHARGIAADNFAARLEGSGSIQLAGTADALVASIDGSGSLAALALVVARVTVSVEGSGGAEVSAHEKVTAAINGSGSVRYTGGAKDVTETVAGSGTVTPM